MSVFIDHTTTRAAAVHRARRNDEHQGRPWKAEARVTERHGSRKGVRHRLALVARGSCEMKDDIRREPSEAPGKGGRIAREVKCERRDRTNTAARLSCHSQSPDPVSGQAAHQVASNEPGRTGHRRGMDAAVRVSTWSQDFPPAAKAAGAGVRNVGSRAGCRLRCRPGAVSLRVRP